jgi:hypothetical protein
MKRLTQQEVIQRFTEIHKGKYDYSNVQYSNSQTKVKIICPIHGSWLQTPSDHFGGHGCLKCDVETRKELKYTLEELLQKCRDRYKDNYDYSGIVSYIGITFPITIKCNIHNTTINTTFHRHLSGKGGCRKCQYEGNAAKANLGADIFIKEAKKVHGSLYDYSKVIYKNNTTKVEIVCKKHGSFFQIPNAHKDSKQGCPSCKESKGETKIRVFLESNKIEFIPQHSYKDCKYKNKLLFDFYLPKYNLIIEFDGMQHYEPIKWLHGRSDYNFEYQQLKDSIKNEYCNNNNIQLLRIPYTEMNNIEKIISKYLDL